MKLSVLLEGKSPPVLPPKPELLAEEDALPVDEPWEPVLLGQPDVTMAIATSMNRME